MNSTVESNFQRLETLSGQILEIIFELRGNNDSAQRLSLVADSLKLTKTYSDLVVSNEFQINQLATPNVDYAFALDKYKLLARDLKHKLREAQLESKRNEDVYTKQERLGYLKNVFIEVADEAGDEDMETKRGKLFSHQKGDDVDSGLSQKTQEEMLLEKNKEVTSKFLKTRQLLETSAFQSDMALENFEESSESLKHMNESFDFMNDMLDIARSLVGNLNRLGAKQRTQVKYALYFFVACCAFVVLRRTLGIFGKVYWLVSLPFRVLLLPFRIVFGVLKMFIGSTPAVESAEGLIDFAEDVITRTQSSFIDTFATTYIADSSTTTMGIADAVTKSSSYVEGYEELSRQLSSIINDDDISTTISTAASTVTGRIVDEL